MIMQMFFDIVNVPSSLKKHAANTLCRLKVKCWLANQKTNLSCWHNDNGIWSVITTDSRGPSLEVLYQRNCVRQRLPCQHRILVFRETETHINTFWYGRHSAISLPYYSF